MARGRTARLQNSKGLFIVIRGSLELISNVQNRRLTKLMKYELVKCLRTPALLAMFSQDPTTVSNVQSCLKSMSLMEPELILHPILERAVPSLEALVEVSAFLIEQAGLC
jgi:hypothetical protein